MYTGKSLLLFHHKFHQLMLNDGVIQFVSHTNSTNTSKETMDAEIPHNNKITDMYIHKSLTPVTQPQL